jgi:hypothetical protein
VGRRTDLDKVAKRKIARLTSNQSLVFHPLVEIALRSVNPEYSYCFLSGPPAVIEVDIMVRSMGPISEVDMVR